jgi:hypothetical protein
MASKKLEAQQIQHRIEVLDALALSGQSVTAFAQTQGISYAQLRGWQAHGARWRSQQQAPQRPREQPDQSLMDAPSAKPTQTCDFIEARVVASRTTTAHPIAVDVHANAHASYPGVVTIKPLSVAATQTQSLPTPLRSPLQSSSPAYPHDPPNISQVQILCTQGLRSALVNWPSSAPLECAQWIRAYLA